MGGFLAETTILKPSQMSVSDGYRGPKWLQTAGPLKVRGQEVKYTGMLEKPNGELQLFLNEKNPVTKENLNDSENICFLQRFSFVQFRI